MCRRRHQRRVLEIAILLLVLLPPPPAALSAKLPRGTVLSIALRIAPWKKISKGVGKVFGEKMVELALEFLLKLGEDHLSSPSGAQNKTGGEPETERSANDSTTSMFILNLTVGTPSPQIISGVLDITSELVWAQCAPYRGPPAPTTFQPNRSATFERVPCSSDTCQQGALRQRCSPNKPSDHCGYVDFASYDDDTNTTGHLARDTFTFGRIAVPDMVFGCSSAAAGDFSGASGVFGFNRGPLSLVSQLQLSWFSYSWATDAAGTGSDIQFGSGAPPRTLNSRSTPLLTSRLYPDGYFVRLTGIKVDGEDLVGAIPAGTSGFKADESGGVLLSTTIPVTYLEQPAYDAVRKAIADKITAARPANVSALGLDPLCLCYTIESLKNVTVPNLALVFRGVDAVMDLQRYNYFFTDSESGLDCLTILPSLNGSILGYLLQKGTNMTYDIAGQQLTFERPAVASPPAHSMAASVTTMLPYYYLVVWAMLF